MFRWSLVVLGACASAPTISPVPAAAPPQLPGAGDPCHAGAPAIAAAAVWKQLEPYSWSVYANPDEAPPPPTSYGQCRVARNQVTAPDGTLVVELGCGVRVLRAGIYDQLGIQVGARGQEVLARHRGSPLTCFANGPDQVRCHFDRDAGDDSDLSTNWYVVEGALGEVPLTGQAAYAYFAPRTLVEVGANIWCH